MKNLAFDETLSAESINNADLVAEIGDYISFLGNQCITTLECWKVLENENNLHDKTKSLLRGLFKDELPSFDGKKPKESIIKYLNYFSQFDTVIFITSNTFVRGNQEDQLNNSVKLKSFQEMIKDIQQDDEFKSWKAKIIFLQQKFKGSNTE